MALDLEVYEMSVSIDIRIHTLRPCPPNKTPTRHSISHNSLFSSPFRIPIRSFSERLAISLKHASRERLDPGKGRIASEFKAQNAQDKQLCADQSRPQNVVLLRRNVKAATLKELITWWQETG